MIWPWVWRSELEAAQAALARMRQELDGARAWSEQISKASREREESLEKILAETADRADQERKVLLDRIVELSGQPALYRKPAETAAAPGGELPRVPSRVGFDDVHQAVKAAMRDGTFNIPKARQN